MVLDIKNAACGVFITHTYIIPLANTYYKEVSDNSPVA
jgi:hypothetical protein